MAKYKQVDTEFRAVWVATVSNIDISKYKGREVRYVITATIPYNVPCRVNLWEKEWQNIDNAFTNVTLTTSDLGKTYYVKM